MRVVIAPRTIVTFVAVALGAVLLLAFAYAARAILVQLLTAAVLAMALEPLVQLFERHGAPRRRAVGLSFALAALGVAAFGYLLLPPLVHEVASFGRNAPVLLQNLADGHGSFGFLERRFRIVEHARGWISAHGRSALARPALHAAGGIVSTGAGLVAVAFLTLFLALGGRAWFEGLLQVVPERSRDRWRSAGSGIARAVGGYVAGNLLISIVAGSVTTLVLFALHVPYAVPLGLLVAIFDLIPLVGATIGTIAVGLVSLTKGVPTAAIAVTAMCVYQQIENHTLVPLIYHRTVQLSSLAVAVSVAAGAEVGGVAGALLSIPVAGALKVAGSELLAWHRDPPGRTISTPHPVPVPHAESTRA